MKIFINGLLVLVLNLNPYSVDNIEFEKLLRKHISIVEEIIGDDFENTLSRKSFYFISDEFVKKKFLNMSYNCLDINTNKNDIVASISIHFSEVIDRQFYNTFVEKYGTPDQIYVRSNVKVISEEVYTSDDDFSSNLKKREGDLIEGTFDEKPLFMIWEKDDFYIQAFLRHEQNICEILFSLESPPFNIKPKK